MRLGPLKIAGWPMVALSFASLLALSLHSLSAAEPQDANPATPQGAAGMRVYIDPETGEFGVPPPEAAPPEAGPDAALQLQSLSTPSEELVEVPGTTEAGGFTLELNGQFQRDLTITPDADGKLSIRCAQDRNAGD